MRRMPYRALTVILFIVLVGCGQESFKNAGSNLPTEIRFKAPFTHIANLTASLVISDVGTFPMTLNPDGTVSAAVSGISPGLHTFIVTYFADGVILARASSSAVIIADQNTTIVFTSQELDRNFDDDLDGWVNLAEVLWGSDPLLASSFPPGDDPRFALLTAGGSVQSSSYTVSDAVGEAIEGGSSSSNSYTMEGGFQAYP